MRFAQYQPRTLNCLGVEDWSGYHLKVFSICYGDQPIDRRRFAACFKLAADALPQPAHDAERPGVGFAILHQGKTGDYFVLCWWDRENELPTRVFLRDDSGWRPATGGESFCVWDLRVIWSEREAYVGTFLAGHSNPQETYLAATMEGVA